MSTNQALREALEELVSAVKDGLRRSAAGDTEAIRSNMIFATTRQAEAALANSEPRPMSSATAPTGDSNPNQVVGRPVADDFQGWQAILYEPNGEISAYITPRGRIFQADIKRRFCDQADLIEQALVHYKLCNPAPRQEGPFDARALAEKLWTDLWGWNPEKHHTTAFKKCVAMIAAAGQAAARS